MGDSTPSMTAFNMKYKESLGRILDFLFFFLLEAVFWEAPLSFKRGLPFCKHSTLDLGSCLLLEYLNIAYSSTFLLRETPENVSFL